MLYFGRLEVGFGVVGVAPRLSRRRTVDQAEGWRIDRTEDELGDSDLLVVKSWNRLAYMREEHLAIHRGSKLSSAFSSM